MALIDVAMLGNCRSHKIQQDALRQATECLKTVVSCNLSQMGARIKERKHTDLYEWPMDI